MARIQADLDQAQSKTLVGPINIFNLVSEEEANGACGLTLAAGFSGIVVIEISQGTDASNADIWIQIALVSPTAGVDSTVASLTGGGSPVYGRGEVVGAAKIRARLTGAGSGRAILAVNVF